MVGGAKVLGKLLVPGRSANLDSGREWAYCTCRRFEWGCLDFFLSSITSPFFLSLSLLETPDIQVYKFIHFSQYMYNM